ncbi:hypothetical protein CYLTODRAFT_421839 [Cylindrobasidium torrendii FP15055 ss-10]|uniref:F-box domain-containing protein n=1 Tax=Cylindrobasidium torrendii FP15055 ss-10 TaxID=1314674 RepID=A0A0D7BDE5_9AGAR|nr:hypothetical protein CYLTODRAFT_421839 [Cylindrobasidium torrendii FP15055 ss-10]
MISTFPFDLLEEIFVTAQIHDLPFAEQYQVEGNAALATAVSQVCQHWRDAALQCSALWTYIPYIGSQQPQCALQLSESIKRASGRLLTLFVQFHVKCDNDELGIIKGWVNNHVGQLKYLSIDGIDPEFDPTRIHLGLMPLGEPRFTHNIIGAGKAPFLRSLSFSVADGAKRYIASGLPGYFRDGFGALENIRVARLGTASNLDIVKGLTTVVLDNINMRYARELILGPSASTLTHLSLGQEERRQLPPTIDPLILTALHTLVMSHNSIGILHVSTPHLKVLKLHDYNILWISRLLSVHESLSLAQVEALYVHFSDFRVRDRDFHEGLLESMFLALPRVKHLELVGSIHQVESLLIPWRNMLGNNVTQNWPELQKCTVESDRARTILADALHQAGRWTVEVSVRS